MQAVVKIGSSQYLVSEGQKILADRAGIDQVLLVINDSQVSVGCPEVKGAQVVMTDLGEVKGDKLRVFKYTAKSRRRRTVGFRPVHHLLEIKEIKL